MPPKPHPHTLPPIIPGRGKPSPHQHTKDDVGLSEVDNAADLAKPISTAMQAALDAKANVGHMYLTLGPFFINDLPASGTTQATLGFFNTATALSRSGNDQRMSKAGRIIGAGIVSDAAHMGSNAQVRVRENGATVEFFFGACTLSASTPTSNSYHDQAGLAFAAGDTLGAAVTTFGWAPTTANVAVWLDTQLDL